MNSRSVTLVFLVLLLITGGVSCRFVMPERYANSNGGRVSVNLPNGTKNSETDIGIDKETSVVISLPDDTKIFFGKSLEPISKVDLRDKLIQLLKDRAEPDQMVYVAANAFVDYGTIVQVLNEIRVAKVSRAGLLATRLRNDGPTRFAVEIPVEPDYADVILKPNPLTLVVSVSPDLKLRLNTEDYGSVNDPEPLNAILSKVFRERKENFALKPGLETRSDLPLDERIEKTLIIKANRSVRYGDVIKIIDAVKGAGAFPIVLQIDDLAQ